MKITQRLIEDYQALSTHKLAELYEADFVEITANGFTKKGKVTKPPFFEVSHILTMSDNPDDAGGVWWIEIDGDRRSLMDCNVIPNRYNEHSLKVVSLR